MNSKQKIHLQINSSSLNTFNFRKNIFMFPYFSIYHEYPCMSPYVGNTCVKHSLILNKVGQDAQSSSSLAGKRQVLP